jgi:hypothetical protein
VSNASRRRILGKGDVDASKPRNDDNGGGKQRAIIEQVIEQPSNTLPLIDLTNNEGTKPKVKVATTRKKKRARNYTGQKAMRKSPTFKEYSDDDSTTSGW